MSDELDQSSLADVVDDGSEESVLTKQDCQVLIIDGQTAVSVAIATKILAAAAATNEKMGDSEVFLSQPLRSLLGLDAAPVFREIHVIPAWKLSNEPPKHPVGKIVSLRRRFKAFLIIRKRRNR